METKVIEKKKATVMVMITMFLNVQKEIFYKMRIATGTTVKSIIRLIKKNRMKIIRLREMKLEFKLIKSRI